MLRLARSLVVLAVLAVLLPVSAAQDKEAKTEKVHFPTSDGVDLRGTFYPGKFTSPTVVILHALGEDSKKKSWVHLAEEMQKLGFAVLAFDFRGHGASTELAEHKLFWNNPENASQIKGPRERTIDYNNFKPSYYPVLCNDIAAARAFLDRKNDLKACNASNLIIIGADTGATLGAIWLSGEWTRYRCKPPPPHLPFRLSPETEEPEGKDIVACVWLSMNPKVGSYPAMNLHEILKVPGKEKAVPMIFMHSEGDKKGKEFAKMLESKLVIYAKNKKDREERYRYTMAAEVPNSKLSGSDLLQKSLPTAEKIGEYLKEVEELKRNEYVERSFLKTPYAWKTTQGLMPANKIGEKSLTFKNYRVFIR